MTILLLPHPPRFIYAVYVLSPFRAPTNLPDYIPTHSFDNRSHGEQCGWRGIIRGTINNVFEIFLTLWQGINITIQTFILLHSIPASFLLPRNVYFNYPNYYCRYHFEAFARSFSSAQRQPVEAKTKVSGAKWISRRDEEHNKSEIEFRRTVQMSFVICET